MTLIEQLKQDQLNARKARDTHKASLLTTLLGESMAIGKTDGNRETTDGEVIAMVRKFIKNLDQVIAVSDEQDVAYHEATSEIEILRQYLPVMLDEAQLRDTISAIVESSGGKGSTNMGVVMKVLKATHDGQYDGKVASTIVKEVLA